MDIPIIRGYTWYVYIGNGRASPSFPTSIVYVLYIRMLMYIHMVLSLSLGDPYSWDIPYLEGVSTWCIHMVVST